MSFITKIEQEYPDFYVLHLEDGRVIGITQECVVVYENIDDVYEGETKDRPTLNLEELTPFSNAIRMRDDLAREGLSVPASKSFTDYDTQVDVVYISAEELQGATYGDDPADSDDHPFCYVQLKDGRSLYFIGVDLDFGEVTTNLSIV
jgi:hypothetical protein